MDLMEMLWLGVWILGVAGCGMGAVAATVQGERARAVQPVLLGLFLTGVFVAGPDLFVGVFDMLAGGLPSAEDPGPVAEPRLYDDVVRPVLPMLATYGGVALAGILALGALVGVVPVLVRTVRRRLEGRRAVVSAAEQRQTDWSAAEVVYNEVREAYALYATDALRVLDEPALEDVEDERTEAFLDAFERASRLHRQQCPDDDGQVAEFVAATRTLSRTWRIAERHARTVGTTGLTEAEANAIRTARALLERALHPQTSLIEARAAYEQAIRRLRGVLVLPGPAVAELETRHRLALPDTEENR